MYLGIKASTCAKSGGSLFIRSGGVKIGDLNGGMSVGGGSLMDRYGNRYLYPLPGEQRYPGILLYK